MRNSGEKKGRSTQRLTCMDEYLRGPYESPALFLRNAFLYVQCEESEDMAQQLENALSQ